MRFFKNYYYVVALFLAFVLSGCVTLPPDAFQVSNKALAQRQIESRKFSGIAEEKILIASSNALQDMGFNLENSEVKLGVLVANKERDATNFGETVAAVFLVALTGQVMPTSKSQLIRVSLVVKSLENSSAPNSLRLKSAKEEGEIEPVNQKSVVVVRATFHRIVTKTDNSVYVESIKDPKIYQEFFERLSKSVFIEAQET